MTCQGENDGCLVGRFGILGGILESFKSELYCTASIAQMNQALGLEATLHGRWLPSFSERVQSLPVQRESFLVSAASKLNVGQIEDDDYIPRLDLQSTAVTLGGSGVILQEKPDDSKIRQITSLWSLRDKLSIDLLGALEVSVIKLQLTELGTRPGVARHQSRRRLKMMACRLHGSDPQLEIGELDEIAPSGIEINDLPKKIDRFGQIPSSFSEP